MLIKLPCIHRDKALLAGYETSVNTEIQATKDDFGEHWPQIVAAMNLRDDGSGVFTLYVDEPTPKGMIDACVRKAEQVDKEWPEIIEAGNQALAAYAKAMTEPLPKTRMQVYHKDHGTIGWADFVGEPEIRVPSRYDGRVPADHRDDELFKRLAAAREALEERIKDENAQIQRDVTPALLEEYQRQQEEKARKAAEEKALKDAAIAKRAAERLSSGFWERGTSSYNTRREGKPWCARVSAVDSRGKLVYEWAEWTGRNGESGMLRVACRPGDVIAWGQKDLRRADRSEHHILQMQPDGTMTEINPVEAAKIIRARST